MTRKDGCGKPWENSGFPHFPRAELKIKKPPLTRGRLDGASLQQLLKIRDGMRRSHSSVNAVDGYFAGKDLLFPAVGADDELTGLVYIHSRSVAGAAARQVKGDMLA